MDRFVSHDGVDELLGAYALDAVDPDEAAAIRRHLEQCPRCAAEVDEHHEVAALLANTGADAPRGLWERIAAEIDRPAPHEADRLALRTIIGAPRRGALPEARWRRMAWSVASGAAAAALVVIAVLGVQVGRLDHRVGQLDAASQKQGLA
ncbi:MAG: zf-HC2 domain-containing protein, partial [Acidimicrobiales bacterium]